MATFLSGVQDLAVECGLASSPTTVSGQTGEFGRLVKWYKDAWTEIQNKNKGMWRWMRHEFSLNTVADTEFYSYTDCTDLTDSVAISRFKQWDFGDEYNPPTSYLQSSGVGTECRLINLPWNIFKSIYGVGTQNSATPAHITVSPANKIYLGDIPNGVYVITGDYYRSPQTLSDDADVPEMPAQFHNLIVYEAMKKYAYFESAQEVLSRADQESSGMMSDLLSDQGPVWGMAGPLV